MEEIKAGKTPVGNRMHQANSNRLLTNSRATTINSRRKRQRFPVKSNAHSLTQRWYGTHTFRQVDGLRKFIHSYQVTGMSPNSPARKRYECWHENHDREPRKYYIEIVSLFVLQGLDTLYYVVGDYMEPRLRAPGRDFMLPSLFLEDNELDREFKYLHSRQE